MIQKTCAASEHVCCRLYARMASKRKGGVQQRLAKAADEEKATLGDSKLAKLLLQKYAWGELSPQQLQEIAAAACRDMEQLADGKTMPDLLAFSQLGSQGANPQNCYRDLMRQVEPKVRTPLAHTATIPFKDPLGDCEQSFFLPHEMFAGIYNDFPNTWKHSVLPDQAELYKFWDEVQDHPQLREHPLGDRPDYKRRCVPIAVHGDDVPIVGIGKGWTSKMTVFTWCSLVALERATREKLFFMYGVFEKARVKEEARDTIASWMRLLAWSLWWLWLGLWPDSDHMGNPSLVLHITHKSI